MKTLLAIEASTALCSVALLHNGKIQSLESAETRAHTGHLLEFIEQLLAKNKLAVAGLDAIVFSKGPGSFTGIRLATSVAKALAYAADIPVIGLSSLMAMAELYRQTQTSADSVLVLTDARMGEYYAAEFSLEESGVAYVQNDQLLDEQAAEALAKRYTCIISDGSDAVTARVAAQPIIIQPTAAALIQAALGQKTLTTETALEAQVNYLRNKSAWKNLSQQNNNPVKN